MLAGHADIIIEMSCIGLAVDGDRRRCLTGLSRHRETPRSLVIELNADGTDYACMGEMAVDDFRSSWDVLFGVLDEAQRKETRKNILKLWPDDHPKPKEITLWRWLDRAVAERRVLRGGCGRRNDPFVFWLPGKEEQWAKTHSACPICRRCPMLFRTTFTRDKS